MYPFPQTYKGDPKEYIPVYGLGLDHFDFFSLDDPISDSTFPLWKLRVIDGEGNIKADDIGVFTQYPSVGGGYRFSVNLNIPLAVGRGTWLLVIYNSDTGQALYQGRKFEAITDGQYADYIYLTYRNSSDFANVPWSEFDDSINVFLRGHQSEAEYQIDATISESAQTGEVRLIKGEQQKQVTITVNADEPIRDVLARIAMLDTITLNTGQYTAVGRIEVADSPGVALKEAQITFNETQFSSINRPFQ